MVFAKLLTVVQHYADVVSQLQLCNWRQQGVMLTSYWVMLGIVAFLCESKENFGSLNSFRTVSM